MFTHVYIYVCIGEDVTRLKKKLFIDIGRCGMSANETTLHPNNNL